MENSFNVTLRVAFFRHFLNNFGNFFVLIEKFLFATLLCSMFSGLCEAPALVTTTPLAVCNEFCYRYTPPEAADKNNAARINLLSLSSDFVLSFRHDNYHLITERVIVDFLSFLTIIKFFCLDNICVHNQLYIIVCCRKRNIKLSRNLSLSR